MRPEFQAALDLPAWLCENCGFWQRWFEPPPACPLCVDARHVVPSDGWSFVRLEEARERYPCVVDELPEGVLRIRNDPAPGIGPTGYVVGDVAFEGCAVPSEEALEAMGGVRVAAASHPHSLGALWLVQDRLGCDVALHAADLAWSAALRVTWPWDEPTEIGDGLVLHGTGGHFAGHAVLHDERRRILFCGDALKFELDPADDRRALAISAHKAFVRGVPLTHSELRRYRDVFAPLEFTTTFTPFEQAANSGRAEALALLDTLLAARPHADPVPLEALRCPSP
jgi:hypothetical protein